jgi:predicted ester cyclase
MSVENNKRVVRRIFEDDLNERDPEARTRVASEIFAPDFYDPTNPPGMQHGLEGHTAIVNLFQGAFPGMRWTIEEMVAEGDESGLNRLLTDIRRGPPGSDVTNVDFSWGNFTGEFASFNIRSTG